MFSVPVCLGLDLLGDDARAESMSGLFSLGVSEGNGVDASPGQSQQFVHHQKETNALKAEVTTLRQAKKEAEARERTHKDVERELRDQVGLLMDQLSRSQRDVE
jgi:hypothetical protein